MNMAELLEEGHQTNTISRIYRTLSRMNKDLSGGNSGMVALAICQFYKSHIKANMRMAVFYEDNANVREICQLESTSPTIYTVANKYGGMIYTADGGGSLGMLENKISSKYSDPRPGIISDVDPSRDFCVNSLIRKCTDWDTDAYTFYSYLIDNF